MIQFQITQMTALVLKENVKLSGFLASQIKTAPIKADYWSLRCEKEELFVLKVQLESALEKNYKMQPTYKALVLDELEEVCAKYT